MKKVLTISAGLTGIAVGQHVCDKPVEALKTKCIVFWDK